MAGPKIGPPVDAQVDPATVSGVAIGGYVCSSAAVAFDRDRPATTLSVTSTGDRPIQVGSHFHFFEVNRALDFDRGAALGMRLDVPSGQSIRFEAGDERDVKLVELGGRGRVIGFNNLLDGAASAPWTARTALANAARLGFMGMTNGKS